MSYDREQLLVELERDEGLRLKPYTDTVGKLTIGIGRNLTDVGLRAAEARQLCATDVAEVEVALDRHVPWWRAMSDARQRALLNMGFNLGWPRLAQFRLTLGHLEAGRYAEAADECLRSTWARQVGDRAERIAQQFREG